LSSEFDFITNYLSPLAGRNLMENDGIEVPITEGMRLVVSTDMVAEGVHFFSYDAPDLVARKALRVNLSDIASMGARPTAFLLNLALKSMQERWLKCFAAGLAADIKEYDLNLLGGDTIVGTSLVIGVTMMGEIHGNPLSRRGAKVGDLLCVSGTIGDAAWGLQQRLQGGSIAGRPFQPLLDQRYLLPEPRLRLGRHISNLASACIDVSDGLVLSTQQLASASGVRIKLDADAVPLSEEVRSINDHLEVAITGGDDYELLFTLPTSKCHAMAAVPAPVAIIGEVVAGDPGVMVVSNGEEFVPRKAGWTHG
jgi:thiamine-monophosphate kinase